MRSPTLLRGLLLAAQAWTAASLTLTNKILVLAPTADSAHSVASGLRGYGIPYESVVVPQDGAALPELTTSESDGKYSGLLVLNEVGYEYDDGWYSALEEGQWEELYEYQKVFGVRMVRLDVFPSAEFGVATVDPTGGGCCEDGVGQLVSISNNTDFPTANIKTDEGVSTEGLWHYPARITDDAIAWPIAEFSAVEGFDEPSVAAVVNRIDGHEQMVFFMGWATSWALASNFLQHAYIHWMTRGLFLGQRKIHLSTQVDDIHLDTPIYPLGDNDNDPAFRITTADMENHKTWQTELNTRLPAGSSFFLEMCHNGNGAIITATDTDYGWEICDPKEAVDYVYPPDTPLEFMKPPGTGEDIWPEEFVDYSWSAECGAIDTLASWFMVEENRDAFAHVSHTFSHMGLNNATYDDTWREIAFNRDWLEQTGIAAGAMFSPEGIVPPAITGLHNADAIRAFLDNGILYVVGDNTRPLLRNSESEFWPKISNVEDNGYDGLVIVPRWATNIYYNCDSLQCTVSEWIDSTGIEPQTDYVDLLLNEQQTNVRYLLGLQPDPYMFHQANMRTRGVEEIAIGDQRGEFSLIQMWVEIVTQEMSRLTNWPIRSLKHDDIAHLFLDRMARDQCNPQVTFTYSEDNTSIMQVTVSANDNTCSIQIPVSLPGSLGEDNLAVTEDRLGDEPLVVWVTLEGEPITFTLGEPVVL